jgi:hypothetical protein
VQINSDFADLLQAFNAAGVDYLVVGAYAVALHARPRATGDLDVLVRPTRENASRVRHALAGFGAPVDDLSIDDLVSDDLIFQIGIAPIRVDVITAITGVSFEAAWAGRVSANLAGIDVNVIGRDELIANKRAAARPKDLADVEALLHER